MVDASFPGDSNYNSSASGTTLLDAEVAPPVFTPASGTYTSTQTVSIADATPGATIYYIAEQGSQTGWTVYTGPITVSTSGTVVAFATEAGYYDSAPASAQMVINSAASSFIFTIAGSDAWGYGATAGLQPSPC